jgi:TRAP-type C4-dicarboxylate transport system permease small subunit
MHSSLETAAPKSAAALPPALAAIDRALRVVNKIIMIVSAIAMILACFILSYSVISRSFFEAATYWQDEASVFLLVGATFLTSAYVQYDRGHIGIEAFVELLSPRANRIRLILVDIASFLFCAFFAWKSWTLTHEAYVDGQITDSIWAPPLAIPYSLMALGMTLLSVQILMQIVSELGGSNRS